MSRMKNSFWTSISEDDPPQIYYDGDDYDGIDPAHLDELHLRSLLRPSETVICANMLDKLTGKIEYLVNRAKYYDENPETLPVLEDILEELKFIRMGSRP